MSIINLLLGINPGDEVYGEMSPEEEKLFRRVMSRAFNLVACIWFALGFVMGSIIF